MEEHSYTYTHLLGHTGPVTGKLYFFMEINPGATQLQERHMPLNAVRQVQK